MEALDRPYWTTKTPTFVCDGIDLTPVSAEEVVHRRTPPDHGGREKAPAHQAGASSSPGTKATGFTAIDRRSRHFSWYLPGVASPVVSPKGHYLHSGYAR